jgi:hypothetical protein
MRPSGALRFSGVAPGAMHDRTLRLTMVCQAPDKECRS